MAEYTVISSEINKFGFGNVKIVGGENLHAKGKFGYGTGKKAMPTCVAGDLITADLELGQYPNIKNIVVVGKGAIPKTTGAGKKGVEFRTPTQIMRTSAVENSIANSDTPMSVEEIMLFSDELFSYIKDGGSPVNTDQSPPDDVSDIPF